MRRISLCLLFVLTLSLFGHLLQRACEAIGIPFLTITVLRDVLLFGLFLWTVKSVPLMEARWFNGLFLLFVGLFSAYVIVSVFQDQFVLGLYYLRLYSLPVLFFIASKIALEKLHPAGANSLLRGLVLINVLMLIAGYSLYLVVLLFPEERPWVFGANFLPYTWFVAGEGGTLMRMGLPMTGPNHLGVYFGLMLFLFLVLAIADDKRASFGPLYSVLVALNMAGLVATFSRSSMLMVLVAVAALIILVPAVRRGRMFVRGLTAGLVLLAAMMVGLASVELISDGFVSRWITLNLKAQDPSLIGHWESLVDAYDNFARYYLYGYPRGTVGPRAFLFYVSERFNVENSVLIAVYDLGVTGAAVLLYGYYRMMAISYRGRIQLALIAGFLVCVQFLPYLFEPVILSLFLFVYLLLGQLDRLGYFSALGSPDESGNRLGLRDASTHFASVAVSVRP